MNASLPVVGAALAVAELERLHNWIMADHRDLELQDFISVAVLEGAWRPLADRARGLLDGHEGRMGIHGPFWSLDFTAFDPAIRAIVTRRYMQGLEVCEAIGATHMVIHSPYTTWDYNNLDGRPGERAALIARAAECLRDPLKKADDIGCTLVIENIEDKDPLDRRRLAEAIGSPALRLSIDTGHAHYAHGSTGAPPVDYYVHAAGAMLEHVHLQDADGYADRHWPIGAGTVNWRAVFAAIAMLPVKPRLILELADKERVIPSAEWLAAEGLAR